MTAGSPRYVRRGLSCKVRKTEVTIPSRSPGPTVFEAVPLPERFIFLVERTGSRTPPGAAQTASRRGRGSVPLRAQFMVGSDGAPSRGRTGTPSRARGFEPRTSACSVKGAGSRVQGSNLRPSLTRRTHCHCANSASPHAPEGAWRVRSAGAHRPARSWVLTRPGGHHRHQRGRLRFQVCVPRAAVRTGSGRSNRSG